MYASIQSAHSLIHLMYSNNTRNVCVSFNQFMTYDKMDNVIHFIIL
jgi:hypothetical protein